MKTIHGWLGFGAGCLFAALAWAESPFDPPGPPGSEAARMPPINEIEPRTPVESLPYYITNAGVYYLTQKLEATGGIFGIVIQSGNVTLDLSGFSLIGDTNLIDGIYVDGMQENVVIRNGIVQDWLGVGVSAFGATYSRLENLKVIHNDSTGIQIGPFSTIVNCQSISNGYAGIDTGDNCRLVDCQAQGNLGKGLYAAVNSLVQGCTVDGNGEHGIILSSGVTIVHCAVSRNYMNGITGGDNCTIRDCVMTANGLEDYGAGIYVEYSNNRIEKNTLIGNHHGLSMEFGCSSNLVLGNIASGNTVNYIVQDNNFVGKIVDATTGGVVVADSPWCNFSL